MFTQSVRLGKILGIPFGVNYSWFIIFFLITLSLTTQFSHLHPDWSYAEHLLLGAATSVLFFGSVVLHELGHSVVALKYGIPVKAITLFVFGGVAHIGREPEKPAHEFNIAIAGPIVSGLLGLFFYLLTSATADFSEGLSSLGEWLARINIILAVFNLVPGFPLDGGRVLRAIIWKATGSYEQATRRAAGAGQVIAYGFILLGVWQALTTSFFSGLWLGFIGWFLLNAAQSAYVQVRFRSALSGITAADVMSTDCLKVPSSMSVADLVDQHLLRTGSRCTMVMDGERFRGLVTLHEVKGVPKDEWSLTTLQSVMIPEEKLTRVSPDASVEQILQTMNEQNISQIPVVESSKLLGLIGRDRLLRLVQTHLELKT